MCHRCIINGAAGKRDAPNGTLFVSESSVLFDDLGDDDVIVKVNSDVLTKHDLLKRSLAVAALMKVRTPALSDYEAELEGRKGVSSLILPYIVKRLYIQEANRIGLKDDVTVREAAEQNVANLAKWKRNPSYEDILAALPAKMADALRTAIDEDVLSRSLILHDLGTDIVVTTQDIVRVENYIAAHNDRVAVSNAVNSRLSKDVYAAATNGADFAELAKRFSDWNAEDGVLWGPWDRADLKNKSPKLLEWAEKAKPGDIIGPIDIDDGLSVVKFVARDHLEDLDDPDLAEEVIREYGYEHVVPTFLKSAAVTGGGKNPEQLRQDKVKRTMCAQGYSEISTLAFYADSDLDDLHIAEDAPERNVVRIKNPITEKLSIMRPMLIPSVLKIVIENLKRGNMEGRIFEMGNVYIPREDGSLPLEQMHLGFAAFGNEEDFFSVKGSVEALGEAFGLKFEVERPEGVPYLHPGISAWILCEGERIGVFGKLANEVTAELKLHKDSKSHHRIFLGEIDYAKMISHAAASFRYRPISVYPPVERDLALTVDEKVTCGEMMSEISRACKQVTDVKLFDIYRGQQIGAGKKSMAFKITFESADHALEPDEVDKYIKKILGNLKYKLGAEIR